MEGSLHKARNTNELLVHIFDNVFITDADCWEWTRAKSGRYGVVSYKGKQVGVHRLMWELHNGPPPEGMYVCHHCDNPPCCKLEHLFLGTQMDNIQDAIKKSRILGGGKSGKRGVNYKISGTRNGQNKLTESEVLSIREDNRPMNQVAKDYKIHRTTVRDIKKKKIWSWLAPNNN